MCTEYELASEERKEELQENCEVHRLHTNLALMRLADHEVSKTKTSKELVVASLLTCQKVVRALSELVN